jgi:uncharacterized protein DUF6065
VPFVSAGNDPELKRQHDAWTSSRASFNTDLKKPGCDAQSEKWQNLYYRGLDPEGRATAQESHRTRLRLKPFKPPSGSSE